MMRLLIGLTVLISCVSYADVDGQQDEVNGLWAQFADDTEEANQLIVISTGINSVSKKELGINYEAPGITTDYPDGTLGTHKGKVYTRISMHLNDLWLHDYSFHRWGFSMPLHTYYNLNCIVIKHTATDMLLPALHPPLDALELEFVASAKPPSEPLLSSMYFTFFWEGTRYFAGDDKTGLLVSKDFDVYSIEKHPGDKRIQPDIKGKIMPKRIGGNPVKMDESLMDVPGLVSVCRFEDTLYFSLANGYLARFDIGGKKWEQKVDKSFEGKHVVYLCDSKWLYRFVDDGGKKWQFMVSADGRKWSKAKEIMFEEKFEPYLMTDNYLISLDDSDKDTYLVPTRKRKYNIKVKKGNGWSTVKSVSEPNTIILDACQKKEQLYLLQGKVGKGRRDEMKISVKSYGPTIH